MLAIMAFRQIVLMVVGFVLVKASINEEALPQEELYCQSPPDQYSKLVCEHRTIVLNCPLGVGASITVGRAVYGRTSANICSSGQPDRRTRNTHCPAGTGDGAQFTANVLAKVKEECDGQTRCSVTARNSVFGDPCPGTFKYLKIDWGCGTSVRQACEGRSPLSLKCGSGEKLRIVSASYGRANQDVCPREGLTSDVDCHSPLSLATVEARCKDKESCWVFARNDVFGGDPCEGTYKYLQVDHRCCGPVFSKGACRAARDILIFMEWRPMAFGEEMLADMKALAVKIISKLTLGEDRVHLVFAAYGHTVHYFQGLTSRTTTRRAMRIISGWHPRRFSAGLMYRVFEDTASGVWSGPRRKVAVMITGGVDSWPSRAASSIQTATENGVKVIGVVMNNYLQKQDPKDQNSYHQAYNKVKKVFNGEQQDSEADLSDQNLFLYNPPSDDDIKTDYDHEFTEAVSKEICGVAEGNPFGGPQPENPA